MAEWADYFTQTPLRNKIIAAAMIECMKAPRISDLVLDAEGKRLGWPRLKEFFDRTIAGWSEAKWKVKENLDGIQAPTKRVPQILHWCGIFTTYCLVQAGVEAQWRCGYTPAIKSNAVKYVAGKNDQIRPGDIAISALPGADGGTVHHHYLVIKVQGGMMETIDGNSRYQDITWNTRPVKEPYGHYSIIG